MVQVSDITVNSLFHSKTINAEDIISCFSGVNGVEIKESDGIVEFTAKSTMDPYVQTLNRVTGDENWFYFCGALFFYMIIAVFLSAFIEKLRAALKDYYPKIKEVSLSVYENIKRSQLCSICIFYSYCLIWSILIEATSRKSLPLALTFIKDKPAVFLCNYAFICALYSIGLIMIHRFTYFVIFSIFPLFFLISNYFLLKMRGTPLVWQDLSAIKFGFAIFFDTYSKSTVIIIVLIIGILLCLVIGLSYRKRSKKRHIKFCIGNSIFTIVIIFSIYGNYSSSFETWNQSEVYLKNGLILNFFDSYIKSNVKVPSDYSLKKIEHIKQELSTEYDSPPFEPNIIILQIEAFMDPLTIPGITYSEDPIPNMRKLMVEYSSGELEVSVFGGATVNTEFEVLTGLPTKYLGIGDYPYLTKATYEPIESIAHYLSNHYQTTAIHDWYGDFYNRDKVFPNLGFERFISKENIVNGTYDKYYMDDSCFEEYIPRVIKESEEKDFIYGITVQTHGPYPKNQLESPSIKVTGNYKSEILYNIEQYINTLNKVDTVIGHLIEYFNTSDEPIIFFAFGDHQPSLEILNDPTFIKNHPEYDKYSVPYICYNNWDGDQIKKDMAAYQVSSYLLNICKMPGGIISSFHNKFMKKNEYEEDLELIQYDILSGKQYLYDRNNPYVRADMVYGLAAMLINKVESEEDYSNIYGQNFTPSCEMKVNGKLVTLEYIDSNRITINATLNPYDELQLYQKGLYRGIGESVNFSVK